MPANNTSIHMATSFCGRFGEWCFSAAKRFVALAHIAEMERVKAFLLLLYAGSAS